MMFDICKETNEHRFYVKAWNDADGISFKLPGGDALNSDTKIDPELDYIWLGGYDRGKNTRNYYYL